MNNPRKERSVSNKPRNKRFKFNLPSVYYSRGTKDKVELDIQNIRDYYQWFEENHIFSILSTYVQVSRSFLMDDQDKKGFMNIGYIHHIDVEEDTIEVVVYASYVSQIESLLDRVNCMISPRIYSSRNEPDNITFTNFDLVEEVIESDDYE